jgi:hypothetical protein
MLSLSLSLWAGSLQIIRSWRLFPRQTRMLLIDSCLPPFVTAPQINPNISSQWLICFRPDEAGTALCEGRGPRQLPARVLCRKLWWWCEHQHSTASIRAGPCWRWQHLRQQHSYRETHIRRHGACNPSTLQNMWAWLLLMA